MGSFWANIGLFTLLSIVLFGYLGIRDCVHYNHPHHFTTGSVISKQQLEKTRDSNTSDQEGARPEHTVAARNDRL